MEEEEEEEENMLMGKKDTNTRNQSSSWTSTDGIIWKSFGRREGGPQSGTEMGDAAAFKRIRSQLGRLSAGYGKPP